MNNCEKKVEKPDSIVQNNQELIKRIIEIQDLPEEVVIQFLKAKGSIYMTNFGKQNLDEHP